MCYLLLFFFNDTATTEIYTLSLHDALPIYWPQGSPLCVHTRCLPSLARPKMRLLFSIMVRATYLIAFPLSPKHGEANCWLPAISGSIGPMWVGTIAMVFIR